MLEKKSFQGGQYKPLSPEKIEKIHESALHILENIGIGYEPGLEKTIEMLKQEGARVDEKQSKIFFPRELVNKSADHAPSEVILHARDEQCDLRLTDNLVHMGTGGAAIKVLDLESGDIRGSTLKDIYQIGRIVDSMDSIDFFLRPCIPTDIDENTYDVNMFYACINSTRKHVMSGVNDEKGFNEVVNMASMIAGGSDKLRERPFISVITSFAISPLKLCNQSTRIMQEAIRNRIPVALSSAPMAGSTSPITMAGTLVQLHAEQLTGITICQLTNPGAPLLYGGIPGRANLKNMGYLGGAVENGMMNAAIHQLANHIKVPNYNSSGLTDSKLPDAQAGWEKAMTTLLTAMGGSNYMHHAAGMLESMMTVAYEQYVIDDEIIGFSKRVLEGITVDDEHLGLDVIAEVGPGGNYMTSPQTMKFMRSEYFDGNGLSDRKSRNKWEKGGSPDARERARQKVIKILSGPEKNYISEDIDKKIRDNFNILLEVKGDKNV